MKGVIWRIAPTVRIVDLSHAIRPQNIHEGAFVLGRSAPYFEGGTIHVVVVDPGVGTDRRPIVVEIGPYYFVGPDNGVISCLLERAEKEEWSVAFYELNQSQFWLPEVSAVFHGRDIFAPSAAHLANGVQLDEMGTLIKDPARLSLPSPSIRGNVLIGEVIYVDNFGSLVTNIRRNELQSLEGTKVRLRDTEIDGLVRTFGDAPEGTIIALFGSTGDLIISVVNGNAAERLHAYTGEKVEVVLAD